MGLALAAGEGRRLRPLTRVRPKPLCPVGDRTLLDWSLDALATAVDEVAVNLHHGADQIAAHLDVRAAGGGPQVHRSHETARALGTAGAVGHLRSWIDGRGVLIVNADTWHRAELASFVAGWDGERVRLLTDTALPFGPRSTVVASILPWRLARTLEARPSGLWEHVWRAALDAGELDAVHEPVRSIDCGTPADYLRANMVWSGGRSVIGEGAEVLGTVERSVVWPGATVGVAEVLVDAIRFGRNTVLVR
ncbi:MAG: nucleotidyltransferase family protein [Microthrixaceae bacterium]